MNKPNTYKVLSVFLISAFLLLAQAGLVHAFGDPIKDAQEMRDLEIRMNKESDLTNKAKIEKQIKGLQDMVDKYASDDYKKKHKALLIKLKDKKSIKYSKNFDGKLRLEVDYDYNFLDDEGEALESGEEGWGLDPDAIRLDFGGGMTQIDPPTLDLDAGPPAVDSVVDELDYPGGPFDSGKGPKKPEGKTKIGYDFNPNLDLQAEYDYDLSDFDFEPEEGEDAVGDEEGWTIDPNAIRPDMGGGMTSVDPPTLIDLDAPIEPLPDSVVDELTPYDFLGSMGGSASTSTAHPNDASDLPNSGGMTDTDIDSEIKKLQKNKKDLGKYFSADAQQRLIDLIEERNKRKKAKAEIKKPGNKISSLPVVPYGESVSIGYMPSTEIQQQNRLSADQDIGAKQQWMDNQAVLEAANKQKAMEYQYQGDAATTNTWGDFSMPVVNMMNSVGGGSSGSSRNMSSGTEAMASSPVEPSATHSLSIPSDGGTASSVESTSTPSSSTPQAEMVQVAPPTLTIQAGPSSY
ncbi:hypothetical protein IIB34_00545 [PVC group bacterium]|nr:hypothetical protein [PVC group bacterium]